MASLWASAVLRIKQHLLKCRQDHVGQYVCGAAKKSTIMCSVHCCWHVHQALKILMSLLVYACLGALVCRHFLQFCPIVITFLIFMVSLTCRWAKHISIVTGDKFYLCWIHRRVSIWKRIWKDCTRVFAWQVARRKFLLLHVAWSRHIFFLCAHRCRMHWTKSLSRTTSCS